MSGIGREFVCCILLCIIINMLFTFFVLTLYFFVDLRDRI